MNIQRLLNLFCLSVCLTTEGLTQSEPVSEILLQSDTLRATIRDNSRSPGVLSGVQSLFHRHHAEAFDAYDPDTRGASAGLNFEHIISGHKNPANKFTPRHGIYRLYHEAPNGTVLIRNAEDGPWKVASKFHFQLAAPNAIDFKFECQFHEIERFGSRAYAVFFFAHYMNDVADHALFFRGKTSATSPEQWSRADAPPGHPDYTGGGTYRHSQAAPLAYDQDHDFKLNLWSYDYPRFTLPFYFGKAANGMCQILMFDQTSSATEEIRFSLFKFKLSKHPRPAWDFQYVVRNPKPNHTYQFSGRLVWKPYISPEDCQQVYDLWKQTR